MTKFCVVLANLMSESGELNAETISRIELAALLETKAEKKFDLFIMCGWPYRSDCDIAIADAMKEYMLSRYPTLSRKIISQSLSRDTVGDAIFTRICIGELMDIKNCPLDLTVVTSDYHVSRTKAIFDFVFGDKFSISVKGALGFNHVGLEIKEAQSLSSFRNSFSDSVSGDLESIYLSLCRKHPFYNGKVFPRIGELSCVINQLKSFLGPL